MRNVYPFVSDPGPFPSDCRAALLMEKLNNGCTLSKGTDDGFGTREDKTWGRLPGYNAEENDYSFFSEIWNFEGYRKGRVRVLGYIFDFRVHFKEFLVEDLQEQAWLPQWAVDEEFIRLCSSHPDNLGRIVLLPPT